MYAKRADFMKVVPDPREAAYTEFFREAEPRLRRALGAAVGMEDGREAAAEALAYGWEHWDRIAAMHNPVGYLYRVGRSKARRRRRLVAETFIPPTVAHEPWCEPKLRSALARLSERQRVAVMLVHGFGYSTGEAGDLLGIEGGTAHKHATRGLEKIRTALRVDGHD